MFASLPVLTALVLGSHLPIQTVITMADGAGGAEQNPLVALARDVEEDLRVMRGQPSAHPISIEVVTPAELALRFNAGSDVMDPITAFRLLVGVSTPTDPGTNAANQILGLYDPKTKRLTVVDRPGMSLDSQKLRQVLAHELSHALDDERYDLTALQGRAQTLDEALAIHAVIEGSATISETIYLEAWRAQAGDELSATRTQRREERFWRRQARRSAPAPFDVGVGAFPYVVGTSYLCAGAAPGEGNLLQMLDHVTQAPPTSTEQLMHPNRYWVDLDAPVAIPEDVIEAAAQETGEEILFASTMGELMTSLALQGEDFEPESVESWLHPAATGWAGDQLVLVGDADDGMWRGKALWFITWDSADDRDEFTAGFAATWDRLPMDRSISHLDARTTLVTFNLSKDEWTRAAEAAIETAQAAAAVEEAPAVAAALPSAL